jgi:peptidoglycan hydrolase CwlO-like protein
MKLIYKVLFTTFLASLLVIPACNRDTGVRAASEDRLPADQTQTQRDDYVKAVEAKLAEFDQKFDGLDAKANGITGTAQTNFKKDIDRLRDRRNVVAKKLDDLKRVSPDAWMSLKGDVDTALGDLEHSYEQVSAKYERIPVGG